MGYSISWLAIKGKPSNAVLQSLNLKPTGKFEEFPEAPISGSDLKNGWYLIFLQGCEHRLINDETLQRLSVDCEIIAFSTEEHVMCDFASYWKNSRQEWHILHNNEKGREHLLVNGTPPAVFHDIQDLHFKQQAVADGSEEKVDFIYEIPVELAQTLTGFRHDEKADLPFEILEDSAKPAKRGIFGRLFS